MIEFEKWAKNPKSKFLYSNRGPWFIKGDREYDGAEEGWRAALEWIYYEGVLDSTLAGDLIKEELDNERKPENL